MAYIKIEGCVVSQPLVISDEHNALVILVVRTNKGCKELHYQHTIHSSARNFAEKFVKSPFSLIATSAIGDHIEAGIWSNSGEIDSFENKTQGRKY